MQDTLSDFVSRINNAILINKSEVVVIKSKLTESIAKWMTRHKFFEGFQEHNKFYLKIKITPNQIGKLVRVSKPGQRVYCKANSYPTIVNGIGFSIISTSQGIFSNYQLVKDQMNLGGEVLFQIIKAQNV